MPVELINVGFGNLVAAARVVAVIHPDSSPIRRLIEGAEHEKRLVDATNGRRKRAVVVLDTNHVILSHMHPRTIALRLSGKEIEDIIESPE